MSMLGVQVVTGSPFTIALALQIEMKPLTRAFLMQFFVSFGFRFMV